jgi:hypothetical protein
VGVAFADWQDNKGKNQESEPIGRVKIPSSESKNASRKSVINWTAAGRLCLVFILAFIALPIY